MLTHKFDKIEFSEVNLYELDEELRMDSEYWDPRYVSEGFKIYSKPTKSVGKIAFVTDGQHGYHEVDETSGINFLTAKSAKYWFADASDAEQVAKWVDDNNKRSSLQEDDIILSTRGSVGYCALVTKNVLPANIDQDIARIAILDSDILPRYLVAYLNCLYGQDWLKRNAAGNVQQGLSLDRVRKITVPVPSYDLQIKISQLIIQAYEQQHRSEQLYQDAERLLLDELGLSNWKPKVRSFTHAGVKMEVEDTVRAVNLSEVESFSRLDSEHWQPNLLGVEAKIREYGFSTLVTHCPSVVRGIQPKFVEDGEVFVIASKAVRPARIRVDANESTDQAFYDKANMARARVRKGDVLLNGTGVGTLGRAGIYDRDEPAVADNHVTILRLNKSLNPYYLMLFLNSLPGQAQSERWQTGSSGQLELYPNQIERFLIPNVPSEMQERIGEMIQGSYQTRDRSKHLLALAKQAVELYIEEDEETALALIDSSL